MAVVSAISFVRRQNYGEQTCYLQSTAEPFRLKNYRLFLTGHYLYLIARKSCIFQTSPISLRISTSNLAARSSKLVLDQDLSLILSLGQ